MEPDIAAAEHQISFKLAKNYVASIYTEVESIGSMEYLHFLVVLGRDRQPVCFVCAEWFDEDILSNSGPILGIFSPTGHQNLGADKKWSDIDLFVLNAIQIAIKELGIKNKDFNEGDAWAFAHLREKVECLDEGSTPKYLAEAYLQAISKNDARFDAYLQRKNIIDLQMANVTNLLDSISQTLVQNSKELNKINDSSK
jgi:hypothetical protein